MTKFLNFIRDEDGAVTLDWVALSAGIVLLGIAVIAALQTPLTSAVNQISDNLGTAGTQTITIGDGTAGGSE